jgi:hypothetical protein
MSKWRKADRVIPSLAKYKEDEWESNEVEVELVSGKRKVAFFNSIGGWQDWDGKKNLKVKRWRYIK